MHSELTSRDRRSCSLVPDPYSLIPKPHKAVETPPYLPTAHHVVLDGAFSAAVAQEPRPKVLPQPRRGAWGLLQIRAGEGTVLDLVLASV